MHDKKQQEGEQDFDDLLSGKKKDGGGQDLKSVFQSFYSKMKEQDKKLKETMKSLDEKEGISLNSAKASLSGLSDKLEKRRQAFREARLKEQEKKEEEAEAASKAEAESKAEQAAQDA